MIRKAILGASLLLIVPGCGDDGGGGGSFGDPIPNAQAEMAGTASFTGAVDLTSLGGTPASESALGQSFAVYSSLSQMSSIKQGQAGTSSREEQIQNVWDEACVTTSGNTATYTACDSGDATIDGTVTGSATNVDIDLVITTSQVEITMDGNLDFSATSLTGYLNYDTALDAGGQSIVTTYRGIYNITMDGQGCATGGDVQVHYTVSGGTGIDVWSKAEFGPDCGDVTFY